MPKMNCPCASATAFKRKPLAGSTTVITAAAIRAPLMSSTTPCSEVDPSWASVGCGSVRLSRTKSAAQRWRRQVENCMARIPQSGDVPIAVQPSYTYRRVEARQSVIGTSRKAKTKKGKHCTFVFERDFSQNQNGTCCWEKSLSKTKVQ